MGKVWLGCFRLWFEERPRPLFAMYPTNELIRDQMAQVEQTLGYGEDRTFV